jgi:hypothetical protein
MILVRIAATVFLLVTGLLLRRRPILGPLVLLLVGAALTRLWSGNGNAAVTAAHRALLPRR